MPTEKAYQIANDVITALFTNGANQKARRLVLELENGRNGGGWSFQPARDHVAEVIEKHLASMGAVEHSVHPTCATCGDLGRAYPTLSDPDGVECPDCRTSG